MDEKVADMTAFVAHDRLYKYNRMPFRMEDASALHKSPMDKVLEIIALQYALFYIDDITILSKIPEDYLRHIVEEHKLQNNAKMTMKLKKCSFFRVIDSLSHSIDSGKLLVATKTTKVIKARQYATTVSELWSVSRTMKNFPTL